MKKILVFLILIFGISCQNQEVKKEDKVISNVKKEILEAKIDDLDKITLKLNIEEKDLKFKIRDFKDNEIETKSIVYRGNKIYDIILEKQLDVSKKYLVFADGINDKETEIGKVLSNPIFDYSEDILGVIYKKDATLFKVWLPLASSVEVLIFEKDSENSYNIIMDKNLNGVWESKLGGDLKGKEYLYKEIKYGKINFIIDPNAKKINKETNRGVVD